MDFKFSVLDVESDVIEVVKPQIFWYTNTEGEYVVTVYFMENTAAVITKGFAKPMSGKMVLRHEVEYPDGIAMASLNIRKIKYVFSEPEGMPAHFEFESGKIFDQAC